MPLVTPLKCPTSVSVTVEATGIPEALETRALLAVMPELSTIAPPLETMILLLVNAAIELVPPLAIGMVPVNDILGVAPPELESGPEAPTLVTAPLLAGAQDKTP